VLERELFGYLWSEECSNNMYEKDVRMGREVKLRDTIMTEECIITEAIHGTALTRLKRMEVVGEALSPHNSFL
jgi:hypothetical protein